MELSPYNEPYDQNVKKWYIYKKPPFFKEPNRELLLITDYDFLTLGEIIDSTFVTQDEKSQLEYIPLDLRVIKAFKILRDALGKPIKVTSSFRSKRHEFSQGRDGNSQHTEGKALDLKGVGLVELLKTALETKNDLYKQLRAVGVNGFGIYEKQGFIHIDVRPAKADGGYAFWTGAEDEDLKKKSTSILTIVATVTFGIALIVAGFFKKRKKKK